MPTWLNQRLCYNPRLNLSGLFWHVTLSFRSANGILDNPLLLTEPNVMIQTVRGTRDLLPADMPLWHRVEDVAREAFRRYGFYEIRTPIFEKTELFARGVGEA